MNKKTITTALFAILALAAICADRTPQQIRTQYKALTTEQQKAEFRKQITIYEFRDMCDDVLQIAQTNVEKAAVLATYPCNLVNMLKTSQTFSRYAAEYDQKFSAAGVGYPSPDVYDVCPKMVELWMTNNAQKAEKMKVTMLLVRKYNRFNPHEFTPPEKANFIMEEHRFWGLNVQDSIKGLVERAYYQLRKKMRAAGKPITIRPDGTNPVQDEMDALTSAFNSPRYAGVKEWFAKWYPEYKWIDTVWETDEEVTALKNEVFDGDKPFNKMNQNTLRANLGVVEYNKFVQAYNN